jgi:hypothetical protein
MIKADKNVNKAMNRMAELILKKSAMTPVRTAPMA